MQQRPLLSPRYEPDSDGTGNAGRIPQNGAAQLPVLTQPGLGTTTATVTTITTTGGDWSAGLFESCADGCTCVTGALLPCCLELSLAHQLGESMWLPLLPASALAMRVAFRERFKIRIHGWTLAVVWEALAVK
ncbi:PLAC8-like protein 1 isoform X2 [Brachyhypopomus gauderio]|uniref:PLAC8-like protein 1 isoform X2 n=1 Tax=Brachyhypopomus gauderio TaxID=698409 RepID=UPI0040421C3F